MKFPYTKLLVPVSFVMAFLLFVTVPEIRADEYNVMEFGAVKDTSVMSTLAFNNAIRACHTNGGGIVVVPAGNYRTGTVTLLDRVEFHLENGAVIFAGTSHEDFPRQEQPQYRSQKDPGGWHALFYAEGAEEIALTGSGTINGLGAYQEPRTEALDGDRDGRPRNILFISCRRVRVEGLTMLHSGLWNQHYLNCEDVTIDGIEVYNHANHNNDQLDIDGCRRVTVSNCIMDSDDDGITLKSTGAAPCEDITVTNCVVSSHCNAIKAGTESTGGFRNIAISNCVIKPSRNSEHIYGRPSGISGISLIIVDGGVMEGVIISNVVIEGTECPLYIRLGNRARKHTEGAPEPPVGKIRNIMIDGLVAYNTGNWSSSITAIPGSYIENLTLNNIQLFNTGGLSPGDYIADLEQVDEAVKSYPQPTRWEELPSSALFIRHAKNIMIRGLMTGSGSPDPRVPVIAGDVHGLSITNSMVTGNHTAETYFYGKDVSELVIEKPLGWEKQVKILDQ